VNPFISDTIAITIKELKQLRRDPVSLLLTILFPIILIGIFIIISSAFSATTYNIPVVVADLDHSSASKELLDKLTTSPDIRVTQLVQTQEQGFQVVSAGQAVGTVVIPQGFGKDIARGHAFIVTETDDSKPTSAALASGAVAQAIREVLDESQFGYLNFGVKIASVEVITRHISGRSSTGDVILPGFLGMITILGAFDDIANAITRERERGTFSRLILSPASMFAIYSGKMVATVVLTVLRTALVLIIFKLDGLVIRGNMWLIFFTTTLIAIFTLSLGLVISSRIRSSATLTVLEIAMTFPLFSLAGTTQSPLLLAPGGAAIAYSLPWTYGNDALRRIIFLGLGLNAIGGDLLILLVSSVTLLPVAILLSKRTM
jgi:ABC-2 type transport system permease protein